uniref:Uncharacterized protein n=1 Tax=Anopheles albimanus TaxID=7167 RepID=A0A182F7L2_ANOAL
MDPFGGGGGGGWPVSPLRGGGSLYDNISNDGIPMDALAELQDTGFEPQTRARSNTWPLPRPENFVEPETELDSSKCSNQQLASNPEQCSYGPCPLVVRKNRKKTQKVVKGEVAEVKDFFALL